MGISSIITRGYGFSAPLVITAGYNSASAPVFILGTVALAQRQTSAVALLDFNSSNLSLAEKLVSTTTLKESV